MRTCTNVMRASRARQHEGPGVCEYMADPHVEYLAHHWIVLAVPAFLPAVIVVGVVLYVAIRDRRTRETGTEPSPDSDAPPARGGTADNSNQRTDAADDKRD